MSLPKKYEYIQYRLEKARETYEVAKLLVANEAWNSAINRLYYAAYYAVSALLVQSGILTKTHSGVKTQFLLHYIKSGKIELDHGKVYADLFDWRQKGDYGDFFDFTEEDVLSVLKPTERLIAEVKTLIEKEGLHEEGG
jgi:uncharacterized protein